MKGGVVMDAYVLHSRCFSELCKKVPGVAIDENMCSDLQSRRTQFSYTGQIEH